MRGSVFKLLTVRSYFQRDGRVDRCGGWSAKLGRLPIVDTAHTLTSLSLSSLLPPLSTDKPADQRPEVLKTLRCGDLPSFPHLAQLVWARGPQKTGPEIARVLRQHDFVVDFLHCSNLHVLQNVGKLENVLVDKRPPLKAPPTELRATVEQQDSTVKAKVLNQPATPLSRFYWGIAGVCKNGSRDIFSKGQKKYYSSLTSPSPTLSPLSLSRT